MFTTIDKAIVAFICSLLFILNHFVGFDFGVSESTIAAIVGGLTPILVWWVPNKR